MTRPPDTRPKVWAIYRRVSTAGQEENGLGLDVQQQQCEAWLAERHLDVGPTFTDVCSGALAERDGVGELMIASRDREYPVRIVGVIVARLDRLAREVMVQEYLIAQLRETYGLALRLVDAGEDNLLDDADGDPMRKLVRTIMGAINEFDRKMIARRTAAARRILLNQGKHAGGPLGHGVILQADRTKAMEPRLVPLVRDALRMRDLGVTYGSIGEFWTQSGWVGLGRAGWPPKNVERKIKHLRKLGYQPAELLSARAALFTGGIR